MTIENTDILAGDLTPERTLTMIATLLNQLPDNAARTDALTDMLIIGVNFLRQFNGDQFVHGLLGSAVKSLSAPPDFVYRAPQERRAESTPHVH